MKVPRTKIPAKIRHAKYRKSESQKKVVVIRCYISTRYMALTNAQIINCFN